MESKIDVQELIELHPGEFFSIFRGETVPSASFFIPDDEKSCSSDPVVINRYISVDAPRLDRLRRLVPRTAQRRIPSPENVSTIIGVLTAKPSRKRRKIRTEPHTIVDTFQQRIAGRQAAMAMLEEYDTDINARESALWETAVNTLKTTTREERRIRYITLNRLEPHETKEENQISVRAEKANINLLTLLQDNNHPTGHPVNWFHQKKTTVRTGGTGCTEQRPCQPWHGFISSHDDIFVITQPRKHTNIFTHLQLITQFHFHYIFVIGYLERTE